MAAFFPFFLFISCALGVSLAALNSNVTVGAVVAILGLFCAYIAHKQNRHFIFQLMILISFSGCAYIWAMPFYDVYKNDYVSYRKTFSLRVRTLPQSKQNMQLYRAIVYKINDRPVNIRVKVHDFSTLKKKYAWRYQIEGRLSKRQYKGYSYYQLWVKKDAHQEVVPSAFDRVLSSIHSYVLGVYERYLSQQTAVFFSSVFLGRRELLPLAIKKVFLSTGTIHLLAISGLHMGLIMGIVMYLLTFFMLSFRPRIVISLMILFCYVFLVGPTPATVRAAIMCAVFGVTFLLKRRTHPFNSLGLAGCICLLIDPTWITYAGFQLSFLSVLGIIAGYKFLPIQIYSRNNLMTYVKNIFFSSVFVTIFIWPLTAWYFHYIHIWSILINIVVVPLFILIVFIHCIFLLFSFIPLFAELIGGVISLFVGMFLSFLQMLSHLPLAITVPRMHIAVVIIYYSAITVLFVFFFIKRFTYGSLSQVIEKLMLAKREKHFSKQKNKCIIKRKQ